MLRGHVFSEQIFGVNIFALFVNQFLGGHNGIVKSYKNEMAMTNTSNSITVDTGVCVVQGRYIEEHTGSIINYAKTDNLYCSLVIEIDLGKTNTKTSLLQAYYKVLEGENSYPILTQDDIVNENGNIYQFELARFQNGSSGITNFTDRRSYSDFDSVYNGVVKPGFIQMYAGDTAPTGWLMCDGSAVSRVNYSDLFAVIGTTYGSGDGSTTFNLPDLRGRVAVGYKSSDTSFDTLGETGGEKTHTLTTQEIPSHGHNSTAAPSDVASGTTKQAILYKYTNATTYSAPTSTTGGGEAHNNLQPYIVTNYIIRT